MGQVCGKINNHEREWISLEEQQKRFSIHKLVDVYLGLGSEHVCHELFDHEIAHLIADYAMMDDNWSKACRFIGQQSVPAFPEEHMSEIGDPNSVFYFIPAGSLHEFQVNLSSYARTVLGIPTLPSRLQIIAYDMPDKDRYAPHDAKWALMKRNLLQGSCFKTYEEQERLAKVTHIAIPSIQTIAKILLLDNAVQLNDAIQEDNEVLMAIQTEVQKETAKRIKPLLFPTCTRVKQTSSSWGHLIIGCSTFVEIFPLPDDARCPSYGLALLKEF